MTKVEDVECGAELSFSDPRVRFADPSASSSNFVFKRPNFGFRQTDGQTSQKRVFVFDDIFHPVWWEKVKSKTKTRFCFSFLSNRLDHSKRMNFKFLSRFAQLYLQQHTVCIRCRQANNGCSIKQLDI